MSCHCQGGRGKKKTGCAKQQERNKNGTVPRLWRGSAVSLCLRKYPGIVKVAGEEEESCAKKQEMLLLCAKALCTAREIEVKTRCFFVIGKSSMLISRHQFQKLICSIFQCMKSCPRIAYDEYESFWRIDTSLFWCHLNTHWHIHWILHEKEMR